MLIAQHEDGLDLDARVRIIPELEWAARKTWRMEKSRTMRPIWKKTTLKSLPSSSCLSSVMGALICSRISVSKYSESGSV